MNKCCASVSRKRSPSKSRASRSSKRIGGCGSKRSPSRSRSRSAKRSSKRSGSKGCSISKKSRSRSIKRSTNKCRGGKRSSSPRKRSSSPRKSCSSLRRSRSRSRRSGKSRSKGRGKKGKNDKFGCYKPGPVTNNGYLNFLRYFRRCNCGISPQNIIRRGARKWCSMTPEERSRYHRMACKVSTSKRRLKRSICRSVKKKVC